MEKSLAAQLAEFDGKAVTLLGEIEAQFGENTDYLDSVIGIVTEQSGHIADGATWLIKSALEQGRALSSGQVQSLVEAAGQLPTWGAQLHLCQSVRFLSINADDADRLAAWLAPLLEHQRPFLRAWSLDALYRVSLQHPVHKSAFNAALEKAQNDDAASVRARARKLV